MSEQPYTCGVCGARVDEEIVHPLALCDACAEDVFDALRVKLNPAVEAFELLDETLPDVTDEPETDPGIKLP